MSFKGRAWRRLQFRILEGSAGAEILAAGTIIALAFGWLIDPPAASPPPGILYRVISVVFPQLVLWLIVGVGLVHAAMLAAPPERRYLFARKVCCAIEASAWVLVLVGLWERRQIATVVFLVLWIGLLFVATSRKVYHL